MRERSQQHRNRLTKSDSEGGKLGPHSYSCLAEQVGVHFNPVPSQSFGTIQYKSNTKPEEAGVGGGVICCNTVYFPLNGATCVKSPLPASNKLVLAHLNESAQGLCWYYPLLRFGG